MCWDTCCEQIIAVSSTYRRPQSLRSCSTPGLGGGSTSLAQTQMYSKFYLFCIQHTLVAGDVCYMEVLTCHDLSNLFWADYCCIWPCLVHICEHMCTFKVLGEHSGMCTVISSTAHLHIWRDMLHVGTNMPGISMSFNLFWADFALYGTLKYTLVSLCVLSKG